MKIESENKPLSSDELHGIAGGVTGFGVETDRRLALQQQLTEIFKSNNPPSFGPIHLLDR